MALMHGINQYTFSDDNLEKKKMPVYFARGAHKINK